MTRCASNKTLTRVLRSDEVLKKVSTQKNKYRVQIIYTEISRDKKGQIKLRDHKFNVDTSLYFYPASTVKLLVSALAIEKLNAQLNYENLLQAPLKAFAIGPCQTEEVYDSTARYHWPSIDHYIHKMLLVSDNYAYNRVFDFLGQDYIQHRLPELGFNNARIIQRFDPTCNAEANRFHNRFEFFRSEDSSFLLSHTAKTTAIYTNPVNNVSIGKGYYYGDSLVNHPRQFRYNNNIPLETLHQSLIRIILPNTFPDSLQFGLTQMDYRYLKPLLGMYPYESDFPRYDSSYFPAYKKYVFYGRDKNALINSDLRIYNIVGQAYGFTTDAAYFEDIKNNVSFFLSATIYTNEDEILNDDKYEYDTIAFPFMKALGQEIYRKEVEKGVRRKW